MFIGSAHVFSANLYVELRQKHLQYDSIPTCFFLVSIQIMLENTHTPPMNASSENSLLIALDKNFYFDKMEMLFEGVRHFRFSGRNDSNVSTINGYSLEIRTDLLGKTRNNKLIVWTDDCKVEHRNGYFDFEKDNCIVIADSLKYRFIV